MPASTNQHTADSGVARASLKGGRMAIRASQKRAGV